MDLKMVMFAGDGNVLFVLVDHARSRVFKTFRNEGTAPGSQYFKPPNELKFCEYFDQIYISETNQINEFFDLVQSCQKWQCWHQMILPWRKGTSIETQSDDHWIKSLMVIHLS